MMLVVMVVRTAAAVGAKSLQILRVHLLIDAHAAARVGT